ncbi:MAG: hypothetical protein K2X27_00755 [Candidatus Obscuribacterales bacterium]|nr:hypothetical protein [Candidatus Obscuribacterales bacterium]
MKRLKYALVLGILTSSALLPGLFIKSSAQGGEMSADQTAFQDDDELLRLNNSQVREVEGEEQSAEQQAAFDDKRNQAYRLYAEKRVQELEKLKKGSPDNDKQIAILQNWLKADSAMRLRDQQTINALRRRIYSMEQNQQQTMTNLSGDVSAMREAANNARADDQFRQQMQINYFNELQTEMGPATWVHPQRGATYNMGGMGFNGGQQLFGGY